MQADRPMRGIPGWIESNAARYPGKCAFADPEKAVTWNEYYERACRIAGVLISCGVSRRPVPVFMEKSADAATAFAGAILAGGFYAEIDPKLPDERLSKIFGTLEADCCITTAEYAEKLAQTAFSGKVLLMEEILRAEPDHEGVRHAAAMRIDTDPLYAMFTSGSTGTPKGVVVSSRSVIDFIPQFTELFGFTPDDVLGNQAPFDFDVSVKDIFTAFYTGASVQIIPTKYFSMPAVLLDFLVDRNVTSLTWAVSALCIISRLNGFTYKIPEKVRRVIFSGEVMPVKQLNIWREALPDAMFVNVYGPTEITCNCTYYIVDRPYENTEMLPMGVPFPNERVFLLDENDKEVTAPGKTGELCVEGSALALGYYRSAENTEKVFVQDPRNNRYLAPIYRTGDLAYYNEEGLLCFASRRDFQIKHMGHRIELGEIEAAIGAQEHVSGVCCLYIDEKIVACVTGTDDKRALAKNLRASLPAFMLPNAWVFPEEMPLNKNGKTDRRALEALYAAEKKRK